MSKNRRGPVFPQLERLADRMDINDYTNPVRYWNISFGLRWKGKDDPVPLDKIYKDEK